MEPGDEQIWAPILAGPLDIVMEVDHILKEHRAKTWRDRYLGGNMLIIRSYLFPNSTTHVNKFNFVYSQANLPMFGVLEFIPKKNWRCGPRLSRKRRTFPSVRINLVL